MKPAKKCQKLQFFKLPLEAGCKPNMSLICFLIHRYLRAAMNKFSLCMSTGSLKAKALKLVLSKKKERKTEKKFKPKQQNRLYFSMHFSSGSKPDTCMTLNSTRQLAVRDGDIQLCRVPLL